MKQDSTDVRTSKNSEFHDWITEVHNSCSTQNEKSVMIAPENPNLAPTNTQLIEQVNQPSVPTLDNIKYLNGSIISIDHQDPYLRYRFIWLALSENKICLYHEQSNNNQASQLIENVRKIRFLIKIHHYFKLVLASRLSTESKGTEEILSLLQIYDQYITNTISHIEFLFSVIQLASSYDQLYKIFEKTITTSTQLKSLIIQLIKGTDETIVSTDDINKQQPLLILIFHLLQITVQKYPRETWAWIPYNRFKIICNRENEDWVSCQRRSEDFVVVLWFLICYNRLNLLQCFLKNYPQRPQTTAFGMHTLWVLQLLLNEENLAVESYKNALKEFPSYFMKKGNDRINRHLLLELASIKLGNTKFAVKVRNHYQRYISIHQDHSALKKKLSEQQICLNEMKIEFLFTNRKT